MNSGSPAEIFTQHIAKWMLIVSIILFLEAMIVDFVPGKGGPFFAACVVLAVGGLFCKPKWARFLAGSIILLALVAAIQEQKRDQKNIRFAQQRSLLQSQEN